MTEDVTGRATTWAEDWYRPLSGLMQAVLSLFGMLVVLTPLALWVAWNETVYFGALATAGIGAAIFCLFAWLLHKLHELVPEELDAVPLSAARDAMVPAADPSADWEQRQEEDPALRQGRQDYGGEIARNLRLIFFSAGITLLLGCGLLAGAWALIAANYGGI